MEAPRSATTLVPNQKQHPVTMLSGRSRNGTDPGWLHERTLRLAEAVLTHRSALLDILTETATRTAAEDEINRSVRALAGAAWEVARNGPPRTGRLAVFLPSNNVLYSYVLFGLIPSLYCDEIVIRPSARTRATAFAVHALLATTCGPRVMERVRLVEESQRTFQTTCADADAVVFTGQYENGLEVMGKIGDRPLFLLFGSGPNPMIVGPQAAAERTTRAMLTSRLYNSGQDCLCSDLIFVHRSHLDAVVDDLKVALSAVRTVGRRSPGAVVAPLVYADAAEQAEKYISDHAERVVFGGRADSRTLRVDPTVILHDRSQQLHPPEFFSPIFCLTPYEDPSEIESWAFSPYELSRGMYASVFGEQRIDSRRLGTARVLRETTTFDHEDGNRPFGGHGPQAGAVRGPDGRLQARPLLLSAELAARGSR